MLPAGPLGVVPGSAAIVTPGIDAALGNRALAIVPDVIWDAAKEKAP